MKHAKRLVLYSLIVMNIVDQPTPPVVIEQGILTGILNSDGTIFEYLGIPYGKVNSSNRFQAPYPPPKWKGVFKAANEGIFCAQYYPPVGYFGEEDCLKLNVYVPAKANKPLPVMVFIHGGGLLVGSGSNFFYKSEFLVEHDVILVTMNYRLGILGFLCLGIKEAPGNAGIKDQIAALRWVKKNIAAFGGDPNSITLFGESAGATSTSVLHASPVTEGLFHKAILQSGSSLGSWAMSLDPLLAASRTVKPLGHNTKDPHELYKILSRMTIKELYTTKPLKLIDLFFDTQSVFLPCVENNIPGIEAALTDIPYNLINNKTKNIPMIYGSTSKEGLIIVHEATREELKNRNNEFVCGPDLAFPNNEEATRMDKIVKQLYFGEKRISFDEKVNATKMYGQLYFKVPAVLETEILLKKNTAPVFNYYFNYYGGRNYLNYFYDMQNTEGTCHADELLYIFDASYWLFPINERDRQMITQMTKMWTNFAKYGDPTPVTSDLKFKWERSSEDKLQFLYIDEEIRMGPMLSPDGYKFWKEVYDKYRRKHLRDFQPLVLTIK